MNIRSAVLLCLSCVYFVSCGMLFIPYAGFQHDEAIFAEPIFQRGVAFFSCTVGSRTIPLMINSYAGALKTLLYWPIFKVWHPSAYSLRVPTLLIAAASLLLFWPVVRRAGGQRAAAIALVLLATDSMYLLTSVFDWGPVALQHLFLVGVILAFVRYHESGNAALLALACFLAGLALWEKALFFWLGGGLVVAGLAVYPRYIWRRVSLRNAALALVSFAVGASPLIFYNFDRPNSTLGENATLSSEHLAAKVESARRTVNAQAMFGYFVFEDWVPSARAPRTAVEAASLGIRNAVGTSQRNAMLWAYGLSLLLAPFAWRTHAWRPMLFALIFTLTGWALMLVTRGAGASAHHVILLWPVPLMFLALAFAQASRRMPQRFGLAGLAILVGFFASVNILTTNQYLAALARNGPTTIWSNALYPLSSALVHGNYGDIVGVDWATVVPLRVLERATVPLQAITVDRNHPEQTLGAMDRQEVTFLEHADGREVIPGVNQDLDAIAAKHGFRKQVLRTFTDENGRPIFQLLRFR